jgi:hypothetical protein
MLAITAADAVHSERARDVFRRNHPGGAIGARVEEAVKTEILVELESDDDALRFRKRIRDVSVSEEHSCS